MTDSGAIPANAQQTAAALAAWAAAIGHDHVIADPAGLAAYARSTSGGGAAPLAVLRPDSTDAVAQCVRIASDHRVPLYPISGGRNWGYGDACPVGPGQVIVDLARMNAIVEVNERLAYTVIEAGVSQGALSDHLARHHPRLWADCTGAGPDVSVVGNILDRGFGHTPYGNRLQTVCGMEVVLADGRILNTGLGHYPAAQAARVYPYGLGPYLDGMFTQANFGIVTRIGLWLMPAPEAFAMFLCSAPEPSDLAALVDALQPLRLDGTLRSVVHIGNDMRTISSSATFPFDRFPDRSSLPDAYRAARCAETGLGAWVAAGALYGSPAQLRAARAALRQRLGHFRLRFIDDRRIDRAARLLRLLGRVGLGRALGGQLGAVRALMDLNRGRPSRRFLTGAYWRRRGGLPDDFTARANPAADGCGLLWLSPAVPATGEAARALCALVEPIFARFDFDFLATFSLVNERTLAGVLTIAFDAASAEETARARACYDAAFAAVMDAGFIPYRVGTYSMAELRRGSTAYWDIVGTLKSALDPHHIIAPGRYDPDRA